MTGSTKTNIPLPPDMKVPPGTTLYYEMYFHQGQTTNTQTTQVLSGQPPYDSKTPLFAYQQLIAAKVSAYIVAKDYVNEYDKNNPNGYCAYVKTLWRTDKATRDEVTPFMKGISAPGVPSDF